MRVQRYISFLYIAFYKKKMLLINFYFSKVTTRGIQLLHSHLRGEGGSIKMQTYAN